MRDGLPVISLVAAVLALIVALAGFAYRGSPGGEEAPEELLQGALKKLADVEADRKAARAEIERLRKDVARALEALPGSQSRAPDRAALERLVEQAVDGALRKRIEEEAAKAGLATAPAQPPSAQQQFDAMVDSLAKAVGLDAARLQEPKKLLAGLRGELNAIFKSGAPEAERDRRAAEARKRTEEALRKLLSAEEFARYLAWKESSTDDYARRFFGLAPAGGK